MCKKKKKVSTKESIFMEKVGMWTSYYRENPEIFVKDFMQMHLYTFQKILVHLSFHNDYFMY